MTPTPRETAGVTTRLIVTFVRERGGHAAVEDLLTRSGVEHRLTELEDELFWCSYEDKLALLRAAGEVLHGPEVAREIGRSVFDAQVGTALRLLIGALGSPQQVLRSISKANAKFSSAARMTALSTTARGGVVTYQVHPPNEPHHLDCDYTQGILSQVSVLFGLPPADIEHPACQVEGADACRYEIRWQRRSLRDRFRRRVFDLSAPFEAEAFREQLAALQRTVGDLVSTPDLDELLQRITDRAGASVRGQRYLLAVQLEGEPRPRFLAEGFGLDAAAELGTALLARVADGADGTRITAEVRSTHRRYGWLAAELPSGQSFLPAEQEQLDAYGRLAAAALDAATALEEARERRMTAETLLQLGHELAGEADELGIVERVSATVPVVLGSTRAMVLRYDDDDHRLRAVAVHGFGSATTRAREYVVTPSSALEVAGIEREPRPLWMGSDDQDPHVAGELRAWGAVAVAVAPVLVGGRFAAALVAVWTEDRPPVAPREVLLDQLVALADQASTAIAAARALDEARYQARHDPLTGLANRVLFTEHIERSLADGRRSAEQPVVCFVDLDGFKHVNDVHGHAAGDRLLVEVAARIRACVRETDVVARLSGDEFGVLLRGLARPADAEPIAAELVTALGAPFDIDGRTVRIGASIGVAGAPRDSTTPDELLLAADAAMYRAKVEGGSYRLADPAATPAPRGHGRRRHDRATRTGVTGRAD